MTNLTNEELIDQASLTKQEFDFMVQFAWSIGWVTLLFIGFLLCKGLCKGLWK